MGDLEYFAFILVMIIILALSYYAITAKDLLQAVIGMAGASLLLALTFFMMMAPDVAIAEASIGAGLTTAVFVISINKTKRMEDE